MAKALGRIGTAYAKKDDLGNAIKWYEKSLIEHRTADVLNKLKEVGVVAELRVHALMAGQIEKQKAEMDKQAYINPELSAKAREEGNTLFKVCDELSVETYR